MGFRHQDYDRPGPQGDYELISPAPRDVSTEEAPLLVERLTDALQRLSVAGVGRLLFMRGTFVGSDALGVARKVSRLWPHGAERIREATRHLIDGVAGDAGNIDDDDLALLQLAGNGAGISLEVGAAAWSGENHHAGRADGAVRLTKMIHDWVGQHSQAPDAPRDVALFAHSHGGNVAALATQLWRCEPPMWEEFLAAARTLYQSPWAGLGGWFSRIDEPTWKWLLGLNGPPNVDGGRCHIATMGTPVCYGWGKCGELLHFIHHVPTADATPSDQWQAPFPPSFHAEHRGDLVQQLGVAGTNFTPGWLSYRARRAERLLGGLLAEGLQRRDTLRRWRRSVRLHDQGRNLLVNYSAVDDKADDVLGHAVYTRRRWLAFHLEQLATRLEAREKKSTASSTS